MKALYFCRTGPAQIPVPNRRKRLHGGLSMEERDFFDERPEQRTHTMTCPHCGQPAEYQIGWLVRRKKAQLPRGADERDRARFAKAQSYMVRTDDLVGCKNIRCRKRFDVAGIQSVAFI
jgi:hypothetical protein